MAFADLPIAQPHAEVQRLPLLVQLHDWVVTVDHKRLGLMYICTGLVFFVVGGIEAAIMRWQLAFPHHNMVSPEVFNRLFTMHGTTMVFLFGMPLILRDATVPSVQRR
jgi:cytochrome c oxidase subunit I